MECPKCLRLFSNQKAFEKHFSGPASMRRCKTNTELEQSHKRQNEQWQLKKS